MQCPNCHVDLVMSDRNGVEIDYCPRCRGVWLDRGELDKIIERTDNRAQGGRDDQRRPHEEHHYERNERDDDYRHDSHHGQHGKHKKESLLGDFFDF